jgi:hypothetical protein
MSRSQRVGFAEPESGSGDPRKNLIAANLRLVRAVRAADLPSPDADDGPMVATDALAADRGRLAAVEAAFDDLYGARDAARVCRCSCQASLAGRRPNVKWAEGEVCRSRARRREGEAVAPIRERIATVENAIDAGASEPQAATAGALRATERDLVTDPNGQPRGYRPRKMPRPWRTRLSRTLPLVPEYARNALNPPGRECDAVRRALLWSYAPGQGEKPWPTKHEPETTGADIAEAKARDEREGGAREHEA